MSLQSSEYSHRKMWESCGSICKGGLQVDSLPADIDILAHGLRPVEFFGTLGLGRGVARSGIVMLVASIVLWRRLSEGSETGMMSNMARGDMPDVIQYTSSVFTPEH